MKLIIDDAHIEAIKELYEYYPIDGVTTNPSILSRVGRNPYEVLKEIRNFIGDDELHVQAVGSDAETMIKEAHEIIKELGENTYVKIPCIKEGYKAMKKLHEEGIKITATVVYAPAQALLAAKCGADYVAPYVNRIDNLGYSGVDTVKRIQNILDANGFNTGVLGASFKNSMQVLELSEYGVAAVTVSPDVIKNMVENASVKQAVSDFVSDFEKLGVGNTMLNK